MRCCLCTTTPVHLYRCARRQQARQVWRRTAGSSPQTSDLSQPTPWPLPPPAVVAKSAPRRATPPGRVEHAACRHHGERARENSITRVTAIARRGCAARPCGLVLCPPASPARPVAGGADDDGEDAAARLSRPHHTLAPPRPDFMDKVSRSPLPAPLPTRSLPRYPSEQEVRSSR